MNVAVFVLLMVNALLFAALGWLWQDEGRRRWSEPAAVQPVFDEVAPLSTAEPAEISRYRETLERPLFVVARRPGAPRPLAEVQEADPLKDLRLLGLYGGRDKGGAILLQAGKTQRVRFGEKIGQWTLVSADGRSARLVRDGQDRTLTMSLANEAPADAIAAARAATARGGGVPTTGAVGAAARPPEAPTPEQPTADRPASPPRAAPAIGIGPGPAAGPQSPR